MYNKKAEQLADIIEANPDCVFMVDNDYWSIVKPFDNEEDEEDEEDEESECLADSDKLVWETNWYSRSNLYGAGLAEALVILLNRRGLNIKAEAV